MWAAATCLLIGLMWLCDTLYESVEWTNNQPLAFGFRRVSPDRERWEWWDGTRWLDAKRFTTTLIASHGTHGAFELVNRYEVTTDHPFKATKGADDESR